MNSKMTAGLGLIAALVATAGACSSPPASSEPPPPDADSAYTETLESTTIALRRDAEGVPTGTVIDATSLATIATIGEGALELTSTGVSARFALGKKASLANVASYVRDALKVLGENDGGTKHHSKAQRPSDGPYLESGDDDCDTYASVSGQWQNVESCFGGICLPVDCVYAPCTLVFTCCGGSPNRVCYDGGSCTADQCLPSFFP